MEMLLGRWRALLLVMGMMLHRGNTRQYDMRTREVLKRFKKTTRSRTRWCFISPPGKCQGLGELWWSGPFPGEDWDSTRVRRVKTRTREPCAFLPSLVARRRQSPWNSSSAQLPGDVDAKSACWSNWRHSKEDHRQKRPGEVPCG